MKVVPEKMPESPDQDSSSLLTHAYYVHLDTSCLLQATVSSWGCRKLGALNVIPQQSRQASGKKDDSQEAWILNKTPSLHIQAGGYCSFPAVGARQQHVLWRQTGKVCTTISFFKGAWLERVLAVYDRLGTYQNTDHFWRLG